MDCTQIAEKKKGRYYVSEVCGCKAVYIIYSDKLTNDKRRAVCRRHFKALTSWLDRIKSVYEYFEIKDCTCEDKLKTGSVVYSSEDCPIHNVFPVKED